MPSQISGSNSQPLDIAQQISEKVLPSLKAFAGRCCSGSVKNVGSTERAISSVLGGLLLARGLARGKLGGMLLTAAGGSLVYRGMTGHCGMYQGLGISTHEEEGERKIVKGVKIEETITIARSAHDLFEVWTQWERLPEIMPHLDEVKDLGQGKTRWTARAPLGMRLTWEAEVINQEADRLVAWQSLTGGEVDTAGSVRFDALGDESTAMTVSMQYHPPGGRVTAMVAEFFGIGLDERLQNDLRRFKTTMEASRRTGV